MSRTVARQFGSSSPVTRTGNETPAPSGTIFELLWTNPSPSAEFSPQTISLDLSDYDAVFIPMISASGNRIYDLFADVGGAYAYAHFVALATNLVARQRSAKATTTGITFSNCQSRTQGSGSNTNTNTHLVPQYIYGVKFN